jgi:5-methylcytosine-specific restriction endonuclease McrA
MTLVSGMIRTMPIRLCLEARCPERAVYRGRCEHHARNRDRETHRNRWVYSSKRWRLLREKVLTEQPLCECGMIARDVDHVVAIEDGGDVWRRENLQALCGSCHSVKTSREVRARG